jgi:hypothetical protein
LQIDVAIEALEILAGWYENYETNDVKTKW